jgi:tetratricopeptide (TPR) repeat protein
MCFRRVITGCLLILAASVLPSLGQNRSVVRNTYSIAGNVRDDTDQHTMENVRVDLKLTTGVPINTTFTRGNGEFEFDGLSNGEYVVEVDLKDYESNRQLVTISNSAQRGVSIFLARPMGVAHSNSRASVSAHELSAPYKARDEYEKGLQLFYAKSDFRDAIVQFQRAIKDFPTFYEAYAHMGNAYLQLKEIAPAEEAMRKSVELSSGQYSEGIFMLAGLLNDTNRYADGAISARQGIDVDAGSWRGPFELARALSGLKQLEEAEKSAIEARDMKPDNPPTYLMLANIHVQRHDYPALSNDLDAYLKLVPSGPDADQARKTRGDLQAAKQQAENQAQAKAQDKPHPDAQVAPRVNAPPPEPVKELPPPPDPDSSGLPSLPPPLPDVQ